MNNGFNSIAEQAGDHIQEKGLFFDTTQLRETMAEFAIKIVMRESPHIVKRFYDRVCEVAEKTIAETGRVEGAHYNAMQKVLREWKIE